VSYRVVILPSAKKELEAISSPFFEKVEERMLSLGNDARPPGCKKMRDGEGIWRVRCGNYRIIYEINDTANIVTIQRVGHRREIYR
jgi:mRNA interferase RelE/StbE